MQTTTPEKKREGSLGRGDRPHSIAKSCQIDGELFHLVRFVDAQLQPRLYTNQELRRVQPQLLLDYYESRIEW